jgi:hypothetical protein
MPRFRIDATDAPPKVANWTPINLNPASLDDLSKEARLVAERAVAELLQCDQVVVLAGLGISLCIKDPADGKSVFPTMRTLWGMVSEEVSADAFKEVQGAVGFTNGENIEELLSRCQMKLGLEPTPSAGVCTTPATVPTPGPDIANFVKAAEKIIRTECRKNLTAEATGVHEDFLRRLVRREPRRPRANLFTTNYDLCFETAAARIGLPVIDGFSFSVPPRFQPEVFDYDIVTSSSYSKEPDFVPRLLRLYKLHGSVDWNAQGPAITKKPDTDAPVLIYPRAGKYAASYSPPFLEIMSRLQGLLRHRNIGLLSVCCGFNDLHIAEPVLSAVKSNSSLRMVVCAPDLCDLDAERLGTKGAAETNPSIRQLDRLINYGDSRITLINGFFPDLVRLMPMLAMQTDAEQHEARIRKLETEMIRLKVAPGVAL